MNKRINALLISLTLTLSSLNASAYPTMQDADQAFLVKDYAKATKSYLELAKLGNGKAAYQLSKIYQTGLTGNRKELMGLVWMAVAADHRYQNAKENLNNMRKNLDEQKRAQVEKVISQFLHRYGKKATDLRYLPKVKGNLLNEKIQFVDGEVVELGDFELDLGSFELDPLEMEGFDDDYQEDEDFAEDVSEMPDHLPFYSVAEFDIAKDGSLRDIHSVFSIGDDEYALEQLGLSPIAQPRFASDKVSFIGRTILGIRDLDTISMRRQNTELYLKSLKYTSKREGSDEAIDQYELAVGYMNFPWLRVEPDTVEKLLRSAAMQDLAKAQYELGKWLYREQQDIEQALFWMGQSAKQGYLSAQYRLGRMLMDSPWVEQDLTKAYFWLSQAGIKKHQFALRKLAELKLLHSEQGFYDPAGALKLLNSISAVESDNPEYRYLLAVAYTKPENRKFTLAVANMRKAISLADSINWDSRPWRAELERWISGTNIRVIDM